MDSSWVGALLGGGLVATIGAVFSGIKMLREQGTTRAKGAIADMERWRAAALVDAEYYLDLADYWRDRAGSVEFAARVGGVDLPAPKPLPERPKRIPEV